VSLDAVITKLHPSNSLGWGTNVTNRQTDRQTDRPGYEEMLGMGVIACAARVIQPKKCTSTGNAFGTSQY